MNQRFRARIIFIKSVLSLKTPSDPLSQYPKYFEWSMKVTFGSANLLIFTGALKYLEACDCMIRVSQPKPQSGPRSELRERLPPSAVSRLLMRERSRL